MNSQTPREELEVRLTALLLGELPAEEAAALRETIAHDPELTRLHDRLKLALELVREARPTPDLAEQAKPEPLTLAPERRTKLLKLFKQPAAKIIKPPFPWRAHRRELLQLAAMVAALLTVTSLLLLGRVYATYSALFDEEDMPRGWRRIPFVLLAPFSMMGKMGDVAGTPRPATTLPTQLPAEHNRRADTGLVDDPQWVGALERPADVARTPASPSVAQTGSFTVTTLPKPSISSEGTINGQARDSVAKPAASPAPKLPVVGLQLQDAERGETAKRSLATIALPQSADAYGAVVDSRTQPASGLALTAPTGQPGGLSGGSGPLGKSTQAGGRASSGERPLIANNAWGYDPSQPIPGRPGAGVATGTRVEAFGAQPTSRDAGGLRYFNAPQGRPAESLERSGEASPSTKSSSGKAEMLAVRELDDRERDRKKSVPVLGDLPMLGRLFQRDEKGEKTAVAGKPAAAASASRAQQSAADVLQVVTVPTEPPPVVGLEIAQPEGANRSSMSRRGAAPAGPTAPAPQATLPAPPPALKPTEQGAFVAAIPAPTDAPKSGAARKPDTDGEVAAAIKARSRLAETSVKGLSDLQRDYALAEGQPGMPTAGQRPNPLGRFGAKTAAAADDSLALNERRELERFGKAVTPSAAAPEAPKPESQAQFYKIELPSAGLADKEAKSVASAEAARANRFLGRYAYMESKPQPQDLDQLQDQSKPVESKGKSLSDLATKVATNGREVQQQADKAEVQKLNEPLREEARQLEARIAKAPQPAAPAPQPRSTRRKEAQTSTAEIQDLKTDMDQSRLTPAATVRGREVRKETEMRHELAEVQPRAFGFDWVPTPPVATMDEQLPDLTGKSQQIAPAKEKPRAAADKVDGWRKANEEFLQAEKLKARKSTTGDSIEGELARLADRKASVEREIQFSRSKLDNATKQADKAVAPPKPAAPAPIPQPEVSAVQNQFSTFSLNVSDVSFKLAAASLEKGVMPDLSTIRSEEFINAFDYHDPEPTGGAPIAFAWQRARYPFAHDRDLLRFSVKTAASGRQPGRPLNLVLLLDNSGSMERADRVLIRQECLRVLAAQLQPTDRVSVVAFARTARLWVDGLPGNQAAELPKRVGGLTPEGGTNLEDAMNLAYRTALRHFLPNGMNRVVLLTDGAANLGEVDPASLKQKVEAHRRQGIALDCFGIGWDGYNDDLLEVLSRNGDGRYGFVNTPAAAATGFAGQLAGALQVAASDVKVQVEWNPRRVTVWRQIGYAKHQLKKEQFRDNTVDAAEIAAAEAGNALYTVRVNPAGEGPLGTVRVRFKVPGTSDYREHEWPVPYEGASKPLAAASPALRLAAASAAFSEWLASSPFAGEVTPDRLLGYLAGVPQLYPADPRPKQLEWMIRQARSLAVR